MLAFVETVAFTPANAGASYAIAATPPSAVLRATFRRLALCLCEAGPTPCLLAERFAVSFAPTARDASAFLLFTAVWERTAAKYGDFGYLHAILEAGHMAQNVLLVASALKLSARPLGGFDDATIHNALGLDSDEEQPVYVIALGGSG